MMKKIINLIKNFLSRNKDQRIFDLLLELKENKKESFYDYIKQNPWAYSIIESEISSGEKMAIALQNPSMIKDIDMPSFESLRQVEKLYNNKSLVKKLKTKRPDIFSALLSKHFPEYMDNIDPSQIQPKDMAWFIMLNPNMIHKFDLKKISSYHISEILSKHPNLFEFFDISSLLDMEQQDIQKLLFLQPEIKNKFKDIFDKATQEIFEYAKAGEAYAKGEIVDKSDSIITERDVINMTRFKD